MCTVVGLEFRNKIHPKIKIFCHDLQRYFEKCGFVSDFDTKVNYFWVNY